MMQYFAGIFGQASASEHAINASSRSARPFSDLTDREREVLELIAQGQSNPAIADRLVLSVKTVQNHVSNILAKLQAADRAQAIVRARDAGFGKGGIA
jgi:DNA-binding NarL/FixJ family response regulator